MLDDVIPAGNLQRLYNGWREMSRQYYALFREKLP
jgi:hypothetical protein